jgi:hypothetical protein
MSHGWISPALIGSIVTVVAFRLLMPRVAKLPPRTRTLWSLTLWSLLVVVGFAIWLFARSQAATP